MSRHQSIRDWTFEVESLPDGKLITLRHGGLPLQLRLTDAEARALGAALLLRLEAGEPDPPLRDPTVAPPPACAVRGPEL